MKQNDKTIIINKNKNTGKVVILKKGKELSDIVKEYSCCKKTQRTKQWA